MPASRPAGGDVAEPAAGRRRSAAESLAMSGRSGRAPTRPLSDDPTDPTAWGELADDWTEPGRDEWEELPAAMPEPRPARGRHQPREPARARTRARPAIDFSALPRPGAAGQGHVLGDQISGMLIGVNLVSLIAMAIRLAMQLGQLPPAIVVHLDAAGLPDLWGTPPVLWRLPLIAGMSFLMNLVVAWFVAPIDRFAARFALAAALGVQVFVWVAVLDLV